MAARSRLGRRALWLAAVAIAAVAMFTGLEESLLYFPTRELAACPREYGLEAEELRPAAEDGVPLFGWWIRGAGR